MEELRFPKFDYYLDESDPDKVILRRQDGSFAARFSARGATKEGIIRAAQGVYRELGAYPGSYIARMDDTQARGRRLRVVAA